MDSVKSRCETTEYFLGENYSWLLWVAEERGRATVQGKEVGGGGGGVTLNQTWVAG